LILQDKRNKIKTRIQRVNNMKKSIKTITKRLVKIYIEYKEELKQIEQEVIDLENFYKKKCLRKIEKYKIVIKSYNKV
jgi:hypothetical protein